jgi:catechol 2,3-dioxygenase-like lactoylglutathione lyase family enzyme
MLWVEDVPKTVEYYVKTLGFARVNELGDYWAMVRRDTVHIMFAKPGEGTTYHGPAFTGSLYLYPDDIDEIWLELKDKVTIAYPIYDFEHGMREFAIRDCNGYMIQFGQEINLHG